MYVHIDEQTHIHTHTQTYRTMSIADTFAETINSSFTSRGSNPCVCVYVCVCVFIWISIISLSSTLHTHTHTHTYTHQRRAVQIGPFKNTSLRRIHDSSKGLFLCLCLCVCVHMNKCVCVNVSVYVCVCIPYHHSIIRAFLTRRKDDSHTVHGSGTAEGLFCVCVYV